MEQLQEKERARIIELAKQKGVDLNGQAIGDEGLACLVGQPTHHIVAIYLSNC